MRKMKVENLIAILKTRGARLWVENDEVCFHGGGIGFLNHDHPIIKLLYLHKTEILDHFGCSR